MKIVSLSPSVTEILFAIGVGGEIVANTSYCDYPEESKKIPKLGSFTYIDDEKIKSLKPDLVISSTVVQNDAKVRYKNFTHIHLDPRSLSDIYDSIILLGQATNHLSEAQNVVHIMKRTQRSIRNTQYSHKSKVYIEEWFDPPMASGNWVPDIVRLAGGIYFPGIKKDDISRAVTKLEIQAFNPDVIFISYCGYKDKSNQNEILKRLHWQNISAVKNKKVFVLNDDLLNRPGPRVLEAVIEMRRFLIDPILTDLIV